MSRPCRTLDQSTKEHWKVGGFAAERLDCAPIVAMARAEVERVKGAVVMETIRAQRNKTCIALYAVPGPACEQYSCRCACELCPRQ
jgi:hypothetical protein